MHILYISEVFPAPPTDGLRVPVYHLVSRMSRSQNATLIAFSYPDNTVSRESLREVQDWGVDIHLLSTAETSGWRRVGNILGPWPDSLHALRSREADALIAGLAPGADIVHAMGFNTGQFRRIFPEKPGVFSPYDAVSVLYRRRARTRGLSVLRRAYDLAQAPKATRYERAMIRAWDAVTFVTENDAGAVRGRGATRVIPNGVNANYYRPPESVNRESLTILFTGFMGAARNTDAALHFYWKILPKIRAVHPQSRFVIAGARPSAELRGLASIDELVEVTGEVEDLRPYLWQASVYVCPLRYGVGLQNRMLEAMAAECPVVGTSVAVEGLGVRPGEHLLVADNAIDFASSVSGLLLDPVAGRRLGRAARKAMEVGYGWERVVHVWEGLYSSVMEDRVR